MKKKDKSKPGPSYPSPVLVFPRAGGTRVENFRGKDWFCTLKEPPLVKDFTHYLTVQETPQYEVLIGYKTVEHEFNVLRYFASDRDPELANGIRV